MDDWGLGMGEMERQGSTRPRLRARTEYGQCTLYPNIRAYLCLLANSMHGHGFC